MKSVTFFIVFAVACISTLSNSQTVIANDDAESYSGTDYTDENQGTGFSAPFQYSKFGDSDAGNEYLEIIRQISGNKSFGLAAGQTGTGRAVTRPFTNIINSLHRLEISFRFDIDVNAGQTAGFLISDSLHNSGEFWTKGQVLFIGTSGNGTWVYDDDGPSVNPVTVKDLSDNDYSLIGGDLYKLTLDFNPSGSGFLAGQYAFQIQNLSNSAMSKVTTGNLLRDSIKSIGFGNGNVDTLKNLIWDDIVLTSDPATPLPVELESFTAEIAGNQVYLKWKTVTEVDNYGFEIQRQASFLSDPQGEKSGKWETAGFVAGHGNTNIPQNYSFTDILTSGINQTLSYRLKQIDTDGSYTFSETVTVNYSPLNDFRLEQNYPNPFNPATTISYSIGEDSRVSIKVFNLLGQQVAQLVDEIKPAGSYDLIFDAEGLPGGVYLYSIKAMTIKEEVFRSARKMILLK